MSPDSVRLFVAARIPDECLELLDDLVAPLRSKLSNARWTEHDNQHLTLKFLGSCPTDRMEAVSQTCVMVARSQTSGSLALSGLDAFPSRSRIRILWAGVDDEDGTLARATADLDRAFESLGFPSEGRDYTPHLTLARFRLPVPLKSGFPLIDISGIPSFAFTELTLYRSHLSPKGARYEVLDTFPLGSPS